jgi:glycosyltransferase involved in cell wall biosynthesis
MRILMLPGSKTAPPARFRVYQFLDYFEKAGHQVTVRVIKPERYWTSSLPGFAGTIHSRIGALTRVFSALWITRDTRQFDVVFMQRDILPSVSIKFLEPFLHGKKNNLVLDFDDSIFLGERNNKMSGLLPFCSLVIAGNRYLADYAKIHNKNVVIVPTVVDTWHYTPAAAPVDGVLRIGWSGSRSTVIHDLPYIWPILERLTKEFEFEFLIIADVPPRTRPNSVNVKFLPWSPESEVGMLQEIQIGIMPLVDSPHTRGKCGAKLVTYGAVGIPSVASAIGANNEIIIHGKTGYLCRDENDWYQSLRKLIMEKTVREEMGRQAREHIKANYSLSLWAPRLLQQLEDAVVQ